MVAYANMTLGCSPRLDIVLPGSLANAGWDFEVKRYDNGYRIG